MEMAMLAGILLVLAVTVPSSLTITVEDCPTGLHRDKYLQVRGNYCYAFMTYKSNDFDHANSDCRSHKGRLASVRDKDTQTYLYNMLRTTYHEDEPVWIGLSDENDEGEWEWMDGTKASYTNWDDGQPGIGSSLEDCAAINMENGGRWHDYRCNDLFIIHFDHPYICEYGPFGVTTGTPTTTRKTATTTTKTTTTRLPDLTVTTSKPLPTTTTTTQLPTTTTTPTTTAPPTTSTIPTTNTTPQPTTATTTATTTTPTTTTTTTAATTQAQAKSTTCPPFVCPNLSCGLDGYKRGPDGCTLCECDV